MIGQVAIVAAVISALLSGGGVWWIQSSRVEAAKTRLQLSVNESDQLRGLIADRDTVIARQSRDIAELTSGVSQCAASIDTAKSDADRRAEESRKALAEVIKAQESTKERMARLESKLAKNPSGSCDDAIAEWKAGR